MKKGSAEHLPSFWNSGLGELGNGLVAWKNKNKIKLGTALCISGNRVTCATKIDFNQERIN